MEKSKSQIKNDFNDLKIRSFKVISDGHSKYITKFYNLSEGNDKLKNKIIPFFFNTAMYNDLQRNNGNEILKNYYNTLINDIKIAFNIPEILQTLEDYIEVYDRPTDNDKKKLLFRYKKMMMLKKFYDILCCFSLEILDAFFWVDICENKTGTKNLSYRIE